MRVLIVSKLDRRQSYGGSNRAYHLGRFLAEKVTVCHVGPDGTSVDYGTARSTGSLSVVALARDVRLAVRELAPDVVVAMETRANLACRLAGLGAGRPRLVVGFDSSPAFEWRTYLGARARNRLQCAARSALASVLERVVVSGTMPVVVVSEFLREILERRYRVDASRIHVVPNGAPPEMLSAARSSPPSPYRAVAGDGMVGVLIAPRQFYSNVLAVRFTHDVAERLQRTSPDVRVAILGGGPVVGQTANVAYLGYVPDVVPYIDFADVCLLPYPPHAVCGGSRLKALEYFARGRAVLATREGVRGIDGARDGTEVVIAPARAEVFAEALRALLGARERRVALGSAARELVAARYDWRHLAMKLLAVLEGVA
jgi:glycosyltransferase involved in cell wall biosynthesis